MNILVDVTHPAHFHFFRCAMDEWRARGHQVIVVARDKDITLDLLDEFGYEYVLLSRARKGLSGLGLELIEHQTKLYREIRRHKPHVLLEVAGTFIVHAGRLAGVPSIVFYDTEHAKLSNGITYPFANAICTPDCYIGDLGERHVRYAGYQEMAYTHPNRFTPNPNVLVELGLNRDEKLFVVRFVSWSASHDVGRSGFSLDSKRRLVHRLATMGRVVITSELPLPPDLESYRMPISPTKIHDLLAFSTLYIGESPTMSSESAIMGTPFILVSPVPVGYTLEEEERYGLGYTIHPTEEARAIELAVELAGRENLHQDWQAKRQRLLRDKIDVTAWVVEFVERYPKSLREYQARRQAEQASGPISSHNE